MKKLLILCCVLLWAGTVSAKTQCFPATMCDLPTAGANGNPAQPHGGTGNINPQSAVTFPASASTTYFVSCHIRFPNDGGTAFTPHITWRNITSAAVASGVPWSFSMGVVTVGTPDTVNLTASTSITAASTIASGWTTDDSLGSNNFAAVSPKDQNGTVCTHGTCDLKEMTVQITRTAFIGQTQDADVASFCLVY